MAQFTITIEGDELEELQQIVADIKREQPSSAVTEHSYVQQFVVGHLAQRVADAYAAYVRQRPVAELKAMLGVASRKAL